MALIFDIETSEWYKDEHHLNAVLANLRDKRAKTKEGIEKAKEKAKDKMALYPISGKVIIIGMMDTEAAPEEKFKFIVNHFEDQMDKSIEGYFGPDSEKNMINKFFSIIGNCAYNGKRIVSFRGKKFDLPFLFCRALINEAEPCWVYEQLIHNYNHNIHLDLDFLFERGTLNMLAYLMGAGDLSDSDGSEVPKMWNEGRNAEAIEKCKSDLIKTGKIYERANKWLPMRMQIMTEAKKSQKDIL